MESKNNWKAWLYLAPVIILMAVFTFYPIVNTIGISFLKNYDTLTGTHDGFTFDNYLEILHLKPTFEQGTMKLYEDGEFNDYSKMKIIKDVTKLDYLFE